MLALDVDVPGVVEGGEQAILRRDRREVQWRKEAPPAAVTTLDEAHAPHAGDSVILLHRDT